MKRIILALALLFAAVPAFAVEPVLDNAHVLSEGDAVKLRALLFAHWQAHAVSIVVATTPSLDDQPIENVTLEMFRALGIGKKGEDSGILLLLAPHERKLRIEVGYGMEGEAPDIETTRIIGEMRPILASGDIVGGLTVGAQGLIALTSHHEAKGLAPVSNNDGVLVALILTAVAGALVVIGLLGRGTVKRERAARESRDAAWRARQQAMASGRTMVNPYAGSVAAAGVAGIGLGAAMASAPRRSPAPAPPRRSPTPSPSPSPSRASDYGSSSWGGSSSSSSDSGSSSSYSDSGGSSGGGGSSGDY